MLKSDLLSHEFFCSSTLVKGRVGGVPGFDPGYIERYVFL